VVVARFAAVANHGRQWRPLPAVGANRVPNGEVTRTAAISDDFWQNVWNNANALPSGLPLIASGSPVTLSPVQRVFERLGSTTNPDQFVLLRDAVNAVKGSIETFKSPMAINTFEGYVLEAAYEANETALEYFMAPLREVR
jgi:chitinase